MTTKYAKVTVSDMKAAGEKIGYTWFSKNNMAFFNTIVETQPNMANLFITSEKIEDWHKRKYTLRWYNPASAHIETISDFMEFDTIEEARELRKIYTKAFKDGAISPLVLKGVIES